MQESKQEDSEGSEENKGGLDSCSVRGDLNLCEQNNSKRAYQLVKDLTSEKQGRSSTSGTSLGNVILKNKRFSAD